MLLIIRECIVNMECFGHHSRFPLLNCICSCSCRSRNSRFIYGLIFVAAATATAVVVVVVAKIILSC